MSPPPDRYTFFIDRCLGSRKTGRLLRIEGAARLSLLVLDPEPILICDDGHFTIESGPTRIRLPVRDLTVDEGRVRISREGPRWELTLLEGHAHLDRAGSTDPLRLEIDRPVRLP